MRTHLTRQQFLSRGDAPLVWRNLFYPAEILNALGVRMLTMETYAALRARNGKVLRTMFDKAARKGFAAETCSFLRVLEGDDCLPKPDFVVGTSEPCQQGERVLADLVRNLGGLDRYHLLHTPIRHDDRSVESIAAATGSVRRPHGAVAGHQDGLGAAERGVRLVERGTRSRGASATIFASPVLR